MNCSCLETQPDHTKWCDDCSWAWWEGWKAEVMRQFNPYPVGVFKLKKGGFLGPKGTGNTIPEVR